MRTRAQVRHRARFAGIPTESRRALDMRRRCHHNGKMSRPQQNQMGRIVGAVSGLLALAAGVLSAVGPITSVDVFAIGAFGALGVVLLLGTLARVRSPRFTRAVVWGTTLTTSWATIAVVLTLVSGLIDRDGGALLTGALALLPVCVAWSQHVIGALGPTKRRTLPWEAVAYPAVWVWLIVLAHYIGQLDSSILVPDPGRPVEFVATIVGVGLASMGIAALLRLLRSRNTPSAYAIPGPGS